MQLGQSCLVHGSKLQSRVGLPDSAPNIAGVADWLGFWPPARRTEFDSPRSLHVCVSKVRVGSSMGEPWSCKPVMRVRFSLDPPDVAVAEWFRRLAVNQPTRVRFSPVTPIAPIVQRERALVS